MSFVHRRLCMTSYCHGFICSCPCEIKWIRKLKLGSEKLSSLFCDVWWINWWLIGSLKNNLQMNRCGKLQLRKVLISQLSSPSVAHQVVLVPLKLQQISKKILKQFLLSLLRSAHLNLSKHRLSHGGGMHICDLLNIWSIWISSAASAVLPAAAGDRPAAGWAADGEEAAAQTHTEASGSTAGEQTDGEAHTHRQRKGIV